MDQVRNFEFRGLNLLPHHGRFELAAKEETNLENSLFRPDEEVARFSGKHDRVVRGVNALFAEFSGGFPQSLPGIHKIFGEVRSQRFLRGCPAVVRLTLFDFLVAVVTFFHAQIVERLRLFVVGL